MLSEEIKHTEICIIGGGLSGLSLSILLAQNGIDTTVLEKKSFPRHKVCGEYISLESWDFLERLGIPLSAMNLPIINELELTANGKSSLKTKLPLGGFGLSRYTLEDLLYKKALELGVTIHCETSATDVIDNKVSTNKKFSIESKLTIAAYGKTTNFKIKAKPSTGQSYFAMKWHVKNQHPDHLIALHFFNKGYIGSSNIEEGKTTLCLMAATELLKKHENSLDSFVENELMANPKIAPLFEQSEFLFEKPLSIANITFSHRYPSSTNLGFAGDSAGMIAPLSGNGMSMAFYSAFLWLEIILKHRGKPYSQIHQDFEKVWKKEFKTRLLVGNRLQQSSLHPLAVPSIIALGKTFPGLMKQLIKLTHGKPF
ncbi:MAG: flavin-dependent dehydrogenase [Arcticibacterium sp.]|jgi:flavin-dependent dehydrogenase